MSEPRESKVKAAHRSSEGLIIVFMIKPEKTHAIISSVFPHRPFLFIVRGDHTGT